MDSTYGEAFAEVLEILKNSSPDMARKIPMKFIEFLNQNKDSNYIVNIDFTVPNWEDYIKQETSAIIALIYRDYLVSPEERIKLIVEEKEELLRIENELREKYNPDDMFKRKEYTILQDLETNTQLAEIKEFPWYKKLFYVALKILGIKH